MKRTSGASSSRENHRCTSALERRIHVHPTSAPPEPERKIRLASLRDTVVLNLVKSLGALLLLSLMLFAGCSSYVGVPERGNKLATYERYFVKSNFNDNHGMDGRIVEALQNRGLVAEKGPLTMMPPTAQAIVSYEDHWTWDFKTHITGLRIIIKDAKTERVAGTGIFTGPTSLTLSPDDAIERLLNKILGKPAKPAGK